MLLSGGTISLFWRSLAISILLLGINRPVVASAAELDCEVTGLAGNFTLSQDLTCPIHNVTISGALVIIEILQPSIIEGIRFEVNEGSVLEFTGANVTLSGCKDIALKGGALYVNTKGKAVFVSSVSFSGNSAEGGGAVCVENEGEASFEASASFDNNIVTLAAKSKFIPRGGALFALGGSVTFKGPVHFAENSGTDGGAIAIGYNGTVTFDSPVSFVNTTAYGYGAVFVGRNGTVVFWAPVYFIENNAARAGAIYVYSHGEAIFKAAATFEDNIGIGDPSLSSSAYASFSRSNNAMGGALSIARNGAATFEGNTSFINNHAWTWGGAIYLEGTVTFEGSLLVRGNTAAIIGGGVFIYNGGSAIFKGPSSFENNQGSAGAIYLAGTATFANTASFIGNDGTSQGGALQITSGGTATFGAPAFFADNIAYEGAAIHISAKSAAYFDASVSFTNNTATGDGGAIWTEKAIAIAVGKNSSFVGNTAGRSGGAIYAYVVPRQNNGHPGDPFRFENIIFANNSAHTKGGAISVEACDSLNLVNATVFNNTATDGGFISALSCPMTWFNSTATSNRAYGRGGAVMLILAPSMSASSMTITSSTGSSLSSSSTSSTSSFSTYSASPSSGSPPSGSSSSATSSSSSQHRYLSTSSTSYSPHISAWSTISSVDFQSNVAGAGGGAVFVDSSNIFIYSSTFVDGTAALSGAAIYLGSFLEAVIEKATFKNNSARLSGGAVYVGTGSALYVYHSSFTNSTSSAGAGGAVFADSSSQVGLINAKIQQSTAALYGGGVGVQSSGYLYVSKNSLVTDSTSQCCFLKDSQYFHVSNYTCSDVNYSGSSNSDCCLQGQYWYNTSCVNCDTSTMNCTSVGVTIQTLTLESTYWRATENTTDIRECWNPDACIGGDGTIGFSTDSQYCADGYIGPYCAVCEDNYFSASGQKCSQCSSSFSAGMIVWSIIVVILFLCVVGGVTWFLIMDASDPLASAGSEHQSKLKGWVTKAGKLQWGKLRIPIVAAQIVSQGVEVMGISLPSAYEKFLEWASFANLDINMLPSLDCVVSTNFYDRLRFVTLFPLCGVLYLCLTYSFVVWKARKGTVVASTDSVGSAGLEEAKLKHFRAFLVLTFLVYSTVSSTIFQTFACDDVLDGPDPEGTNYTYLRVDYSVMCNTSQHTKYMVYAGFMIIVYPLGIPALYAYLLYRSREHFANLSVSESPSQPIVQTELAPVSDAQLAQEVNEEEPEMMVAKPSTSMIAGQDLVNSAKFLWNGYVPLFFYWEVCECLRRITMTGFVVFLFPGTAIQISLTCLFALVSIIIICIYRPHADKLDRLLYVSGAVLIFLTQYLALNMKVDVGNETDQSQAAFSALLIALHGGMVLAAFVSMWLAGKAALDTRKQSLFTAVSLDI